MPTREKKTPGPARPQVFFVAYKVTTDGDGNPDADVIALIRKSDAEKLLELTSNDPSIKYKKFDLTK